ncbi:MAG: 2-hydroxyacid dehydrogenase, partial [Erysipelotrichaceae bacterium]|nr:2-hydroxyacid dehydrogenase [Erysipelotrichaceae bacterium]
DFDNEKYQNKYWNMLKEKYDIEVSYVEDNSLEIDGDPSKGILKVEQEGPEWALSNDATMEAVKDAEIICVTFGPVNSRLIDNAPDLKLVVILRSGTENVNLEYCKEKGVAVTNAPGRVSDPVADMTLTMMLAAVREIQRLDLHNHDWNWCRNNRIPPKEKPLISDMTIGLIGFGIIAKKVAKRLSGFEPKIIAYDPFVTQEQADAYGVTMLPLNDVMAQSDLVSVHARLLPETEKMIGREQIALMKPNAIFVNTARAGLVDYDALYDALVEKKIRSAALDVFYEEPLPDDDRFRKLDNVTLMAHMSGGAGDSTSITLGIVMEDIIAVAEGKQAVHICNR